MPISIGYKPVGPSQSLAVTASVSSTVTVTTPSENSNLTSFINTGSTQIAVQTGQQGKCPAATFPTTGAPSNSFILPASMTSPLVVMTPPTPYDLNMIGSGAGPSTVLFQPVAPL